MIFQGMYISRRFILNLVTVMILLLAACATSYVYSAAYAKAGPPDAMWDQTYGGGYGSSIRQTSDEGFIVTGGTSSSDKGDVCLVKLDGNGSLQWKNSYGGGKLDHGNAVVEPVGGGYVVAGTTESYGNGSSDVYLLKADDAGNLLWQRTFGGAGRDEGRALLQASDGGYAIAGTTGSSGNGGSDILLIKTGPDGDLEWETTYGGAYDDAALSIERTRDGGYIIAGYLGAAADKHEAYLLKVDAWGTKQWDLKFPASGESVANYGRQSGDRGYIVTGFTTNRSGHSDVLLMKADKDGNVTWQKTYGGYEAQKGYNVYETPDGGYLIIGMANAGSQADEKYQGLLIKTDQAGAVEWQKTYGNGQDVFIRTGVQTDDGGLALVGSTGKKDDVETGDIYLLRLAGTSNDVPPP
jgi:hypothetical protein